MAENMPSQFKFSPKQFGRVAVFLGGESAEREVSLMSGQGVHEALKNAGVDAVAVDVDHTIISRLQKEKFDRVFIALHGKDGEDGIIQAVLEYLNIPYTGSSVLASALAMDKVRSKRLWQGMHISTLDFIELSEDSSAEAVVKQLGLPLAIKPVCQGSSIGVTRVNTIQGFAKAYANAAKYDDRVIAEPWLEGPELTVAILNNEALPSIRIGTPVGFYDYDAKYFSDATDYRCPSGLSVELENQVRALALNAYQSLGCRHWGRVDLMLDKQNKPWVLEVNTIPGLTSHSLVPKAALAVGISYDELILRILALTQQ